MKVRATQKRCLAAFSPDHTALRASKRHEAISGLPKTIDFGKRTQIYVGRRGNLQMGKPKTNPNCRIWRRVVRHGFPGVVRRGLACVTMR